MKFKRKKTSFFLYRLKSKRRRLFFRRLAFLWIFLIIFEIGCPIFECESFAAELQNGGSTYSSAEILTFDSVLQNTSLEADPKSKDNSIIADDSISDHQFQTENCGDECLCHITPINVLAFIMPKDSQKSPVIPIKLEFQPSNDLSTLYQPPQFIS